MIRQVRIKNFKSIPDLDFDLGRVNVLIGANGSGKSNILEALAFASAASQDKLDNEFLTSRGIRVTENWFMLPAFLQPPKPHKTSPRPQDDWRFAVDLVGKEGKPRSTKSSEPGECTHISINHSDSEKFEADIYPDTTVSFPKWRQRRQVPIDVFLGELTELQESAKAKKATIDIGKDLVSRIEAHLSKSAGTLPRFLIYSPEGSALRTFQSEGQILPLGINGEGLFAHLKGLESTRNAKLVQEIKLSLKLIDWFETFVIPKDLNPSERTIKIQDRYLAAGIQLDQRSANEGFLFLLFYLTLLISPETPPFFAIDNIDNSLNPKLCAMLMRKVVDLSAKRSKQVVVTTHNPAVLDGLDLRDEEQRLFVVARNEDGHTRLTRINAPKIAPGQNPVLLSEAFMRGYIGGLPKNF